MFAFSQCLNQIVPSLVKDFAFFYSLSFKPKHFKVLQHFKHFFLCNIFWRNLFEVWIYLYLSFLYAVYSLSLYEMKFKISSILISISRKCSVVTNKIQSVVIKKIQQYIQTYLIHYHKSCHMYYHIIIQNITAAIYYCTILVYPQLSTTALSRYIFSTFLSISLFFFSYFFCDPSLASPNFFFFFFFFSSLCLIATIFVFFFG